MCEVAVSIVSSYNRIRKRISKDQAGELSTVLLSTMRDGKPDGTDEIRKAS